jgi:hypothetical protein
VHAANEVAAEPEKVTWPPILGLFKSVVVTLTYLRRNRVQAEIGKAFGVSQSTTSRAITAMTPLLDKALQLFVPTADELDDKTQYVVDGTLLPGWSWGFPPATVLGQAQNYRHERPRRGHPRRATGMDFRPHRGRQARQPLLG